MRGRSFLATMFLAAMLALGCAGLSDERVSRITPGETDRAAVVNLLGDPDVSRPGRSVYFDSDGRQLVVDYDDQGVVSAVRYWPAADQVPESAAADNGSEGQSLP